MRYKTIRSDWDTLNTKDVPDVLFPHLFAINIHYGAFGKLLEGFFTPSITSDATGRQGVITYYRQYGELLEGPHSLELYKKSNVDNNEASLGGEKDKDKDEVENKDKDKVENKDENKDKNTSSFKFNVDIKLEGVKGIHVNFN